MRKSLADAQQWRQEHASDGFDSDEGAGKRFGYFATVWKEGDKVVVYFYHPYVNVSHVVVPSRAAGRRLAAAYARAWDSV